MVLELNFCEISAQAISDVTHKKDIYMPTILLLLILIVQSKYLNLIFVLQNVKLQSHKAVGLLRKKSVSCFLIFKKIICLLASKKFTLFLVYLKFLYSIKTSKVELLI